MLNLGLETIIVLLVLVGALCGVAGYTIARLGQRRAGGGKTAAELKTELGEYKENVTEHFQTTASLLHEMTEQYRSVYEHMAAGAQNLCDPEQATLQIESLSAGLLSASGPEAANEDDASVTENIDPAATADNAADVVEDGGPSGNGGAGGEFAPESAALSTAQTQDDDPAESLIVERHDVAGISNVPETDPSAGDTAGHARQP